MSSRLLVSLILLTLLPACEREPERVWFVGDTGFTAEQMERIGGAEREALADLAGFGQAIAGGQEDELLAPVVAREADRVRLRGLSFELGARELLWGDVELRARYEEDPEWELEVRHLIRTAERGDDEATHREARRTAEEALTRIEAGEEFAEVAAQYSEEPGAAERGGRLQPGREGSWVEPFWDAASALEPGEVSPVVQSRYGYHVIMLEDRRPVPFEEASRAALLRRAVPAAVAADAMAEWAGEREGRLVPDPPAISRVRRSMEVGEAPEDAVLVRWPDGGYRTADLVAFLAAMEAGRRDRLLTADDARFGSAVMDDAREAMWADAAEEMGLDVPEGERREVEERWSGRTARWARTLGFSPGQSEEEIREAALTALRSPDQEARIARAELAVLRPFLRNDYPISSDSESASPISSVTLTSERKR